MATETSAFFRVYVVGLVSANKEFPFASTKQPVTYMMCAALTIAAAAGTSFIRPCKDRDAY